MENGEPMAKNEKLSIIMQAYADIWADVILDKNLEGNLKKITSDISHLNWLIDCREASGLDTLSYHKIVNHLYRLREILLIKINGYQ